MDGGEPGPPEFSKNSTRACKRFVSIGIQNQEVWRSTDFLRPRTGFFRLRDLGKAHLFIEKSLEERQKFCAPFADAKSRASVGLSHFITATYYLNH